MYRGGLTSFRHSMKLSNYATSLWLQLAEEARAVAAKVRDPDLRLNLLRIAKDYDARAHAAAMRRGEGGA
jgi:hypothetical protein